MRLLLDENASERALARELAARGHDVVVSAALVGYGTPDSEVFDAAIAARRVVVTRDCGDFRDLVGDRPGHSGLLLIFPTKLTVAQLATAVDHVASTCDDLTGHVLALHEF